jgi:hypothetical protein
MQYLGLPVQMADLEWYHNPDISDTSGLPHATLRILFLIVFCLQGKRTLINVKTCHSYEPVFV